MSSSSGRGKVRPDAAEVTVADTIHQGEAANTAHVRPEEPPYVPPTPRRRAEADDDEEEDTTEPAMTVQQWVTGAAPQVEGRDYGRHGVPVETLGAFVAAMQADGKGAARPSYYRRRFSRFLKEPRD